MTIEIDSMIGGVLLAIIALPCIASAAVIGVAAYLLWRNRRVIGEWFKPL